MHTQVLFSHSSFCTRLLSLVFSHSLSTSKLGRTQVEETPWRLARVGLLPQPRNSQLQRPRVFVPQIGTSPRRGRIDVPRHAVETTKFLKTLARLFFTPDNAVVYSHSSVLNHRFSQVAYRSPTAHRPISREFYTIEHYHYISAPASTDASRNKSQHGDCCIGKHRKHALWQRTGTTLLGGQSLSWHANSHPDHGFVRPRTPCLAQEPHSVIWHHRGFCKENLSPSTRLLREP